MSRPATIRRRIGRTAIVAVSLLAHGLVLALLGLTNRTPPVRAALFGWGLGWMLHS